MSLPAYMCHYMILFLYYASTYNSININFSLTFTTALATYFFSYLSGFIVYLIVDRPIRNLDRMVLFPTKLSDSFLVRKVKKDKGLR
jgi:peptidoglycan/LPS O-acetylase OafA/YrhL